MLRWPYRAATREWSAAQCRESGEIVLNLARLDGLDPVEPLAAQVECGAGVTLERLQQHVRAEGFDFPVDLPSRGTATIGGMAATNAGGALAARYGMMRAWVAGVEAVLADGSDHPPVGGPREGQRRLRPHRSARRQ